LGRSVWVIVAAAGESLRAPGEVPKQFRRLGDSTVIETVVDRFARMREVAGIVVALPPSGITPLSGLTLRDIEAPARGIVPVVCVAGGSTRQESVRKALEAVPSGAGWVAVHDAARPFFSDELFLRVLEASYAHGAAVPGLPPADTIKQVERSQSRTVSGGFSEKETRVQTTLDRSILVAVQTPQVFRKDILVSAHLRAVEDGFSGTDDSQLVERLGVEVAVVDGEPENIKLTYPADFERTGIKSEKGVVCTSPAYGDEVTVTGLGFDAHPFKEGRPCVLGGVAIPHSKGLSGHSDADVLTHAVMDALLGAMGAGDIGRWFPETPENKDARSVDLLRSMWKRLCAGGEATIVHLDTVIVAQSPRVAPYIGSMRETLAVALEIAPEQVSIKATTTERMGFTGREEGIAAFCSATVKRSLRPPPY
jgi:2-C-methyl-D-erythritol 4-phosphate cytidylyltransferase/2-C-methyl-D-erythritol 2,4-cyclodiphosphate synthase